MPLKCCAISCQSDTTKTPNLKFYNVTTARASLTEWLLAINRLDVLADLTVGESVSSYNICELHFSTGTEASPDPSDAAQSYSNLGSRLTSNRKPAPVLTQSPVEIVDIQPEPHPPQVIQPGILTNVNTGINPALIPGLVTNIDGIGGIFANVNPMHQTNNTNVLIPATQANAVPQTKTQTKIGIPRLAPAPPTVHVSQDLTQRYTIYKKTNRPRILKVHSNENSSKNIPSVACKPDVVHIQRINNFRPSAYTNPTKPTTENVATLKFGTSFIDSAKISDQKAPNNTTFMQLGVGNLQLPNLVGPLENVLKTEAEDDNGSEQPADGVTAEDARIATDTNENDKIRLQFNEHNYVLEKEGNEEHYLKFEVEESDGDNLETYCFLEEEDGAKRRKVEAMDCDFKIVKVERDTD